MNEQTNSNSYRWVVLGVFMYVVALTQFLWLNFAPIEDTVKHALGISEFKVSLLTSIFPLLSIFLSAPVGSLLDKKGFKFTVGAGVIIMIVSVIIRLKLQYWWLFAGQFGISVAQPFIANSISKLSSIWFDKKEEALANGLGSMAMFIGMIVAMILTPLLTNKTGLEGLMIIYAVITVVGGLLFLVLGKDNPSLKSTLQEEEHSYKLSEAYKTIFRMKDMLILIGIMFIGLGFFNGFMTWIDELLKPNGFSEEQIGIIGGVVVVGGIIGSVVIPLASDAIKRRKPFTIMAPAVAGVLIYPFLHSKNYIASIIMATMMGFLVIALLPLIFQMTIEIVGEKLTGTATGLLMVMGSVGAVLVIYIMEALQSVTGNFNSSALLFLVLLIAAIILALNIKETHPERQLQKAKVKGEV